jgi:hypothetical protein
MIYAIRNWLLIPVLLWIFINYGVNGLEQHVWAIYAMPLTMLALVTYMAIKS